MEPNRAVLLVDNDNETRCYLTAGLTLDHFEVTEMQDAAGALARLATEPFAIVIINIDMPDRAGHDLLAKICSAPHPPVIILSRCGDEASKIRALDAGADDYITRPFGLMEFLARARASIRHHIQPAMREIQDCAS